ncbi:MAG: AraC family transcriptional regulator [Microvirga sp.]|nr:AraC family transcriptional regulator [Microvirga sp.]
MPTAIAFESSYAPSPATRSCWPNVRFLSDRHAAWISLPVTLLALPNRSTASFAPPHDNEDGPSAYDIAELLKLMLPAYLDEGTTALAPCRPVLFGHTRHGQIRECEPAASRHRLPDHRRRLLVRLHGSGAFQPRLSPDNGRHAAPVSRAIAARLSTFCLEPHPLDHAYFDQAERSLRCRGRVRLTLTHQGFMEGLRRRHGLTSRRPAPADGRADRPRSAQRTR